ncbi:hypothetical protein D9611_008453 [Ephemerocybe angulata]|uniref:Uncharacterized protein n=1 Tax=Ephemerocybe angulata TaxID=980116 RepID=A0A8H5F5E0_9AGAR|nr:hypothetical protein D9611_008453 [Tulosesus angulatus]
MLGVAVKALKEESEMGKEEGGPLPPPFLYSNADGDVARSKSQHAFLAIGFFVVMILTLFSTLLYFAERGTWDEVMDTFINSDGDPTQFAFIPAAAWFVIVSEYFSPLPLFSSSARLRTTILALLPALYIALDVFLDTDRLGTLDVG